MRVRSFQGRFALLPLLMAAALSTGCDRKADLSKLNASRASLPTAETLGEQTIQSNAWHLATEQYAGTDVAWGERLTMSCRACHSLEAAGGNLIGPALYGFFGTEAGSMDSYRYSPALAEARFVWTPRALDAWLMQPARFLPGNRMTYAGLSKADDRRAVIAYLLKVTGEARKNQAHRP